MIVEKKHQFTDTDHQSLPYKTTGNIQGTNFPKDGDGHVYHVGLKAGELARRIIIVGDPNRAAIVSKFLKPNTALPHVFPHTSNRAFVVYTGTYEGEPVSVASIGMGQPMVDFWMREARAIVDGEIIIIRLGSCGTPQEDIKVGTVVAANFAFGVFTVFKETEIKYKITEAVGPDSKLHEALTKTLSVAAKAGAFTFVEGGCAATDSFYSSQGREDSAFPDNNKNLLKDIIKKHPKTGSIEMESYLFFKLAQLNTSVAKKGEGMRAAACNIVLAERREGGAFLTHEEKHRLEEVAGEACLKALIAPITDQEAEKIQTIGSEGDLILQVSDIAGQLQ